MLTKRNTFRVLHGGNIVLYTHRELFVYTRCIFNLNTRIIIYSRVMDNSTQNWHCNMSGEKQNKKKKRRYNNYFLSHTMYIIPFGSTQTSYTCLY